MRKRRAGVKQHKTNICVRGVCVCMCVCVGGGGRGSTLFNFGPVLKLMLFWYSQYTTT